MGTGCRVKRTCADRPLVTQVFHQRGAKAFHQFFRSVKLLADQLGLGLSNQRLHRRVADAIIQPFYKHKAVHAHMGRVVEFPLCLGITGIVLSPVLGT